MTDDEIADMWKRIDTLGEPQPFPEPAFQHWRAENGESDTDAARFLFNLYTL
jgi:hypothetical protein